MPIVLVDGVAGRVLKAERAAGGGAGTESKRWPRRAPRRGKRLSGLSGSQHLRSMRDAIAGTLNSGIGKQPATNWYSGRALGVSSFCNCGTRWRARDPCSHRRANGQRTVPLVLDLLPRMRCPARLSVLETRAPSCRRRVGGSVGELGVLVPRAR